jgi:hypothetical protein
MAENTLTSKTTANGLHCQVNAEQRSLRMLQSTMLLASAPFSLGSSERLVGSCRKDFFSLDIRKVETARPSP